MQPDQTGDYYDQCHCKVHAPVGRPTVVLRMDRNLSKTLVPRINLEAYSPIWYQRVKWPGASVCAIDNERACVVLQLRSSLGFFQ